MALSFIPAYGWRQPDLPSRGNFYAAPAGGWSPEVNIDLRPHAPAVRNQNYLGCHDAKTEVLTERGWVPWDSYNGRDLLGTMQPGTGLLEFQAPSAVQAYDYDGPVHVADHRSLNFALTPNHRMLQRRWDESARTLSPEYTFREVQDLGWYAGLPASTTGFAGTELDAMTIGQRTYAGDDLLALLALLASDGWVGGTESNWNAVSFCCFRADRLDRVRALAHRLGLHELPGRAGVWKWSDPALAAWARANLYTASTYRAPYKRVPDLVRVASARQVAHFLHFYGDSTGSPGERQFSTTSPRMADDLQELLLRVGKRGGLYTRPPRESRQADGRVIEGHYPEHTVTEWSGDALSVTRKRNIRVEAYKGAMYCATVPNGTLVTRREGQVLVAGNSCTGFALTTALAYTLGRAAADGLTPSPQLADATFSALWLYYRERETFGATQNDIGAPLFVGLNVLRIAGCPFEGDYPYDPTVFARRPPDSVDRRARAIRVTNAEALAPDADTLIATLAAGTPIVFGITTFRSFERAPDGEVPYPSNGDLVRGGHALIALGVYRNAHTGELRVRFQNSWGDAWGAAGYGTLPLRYLTDPGLCGERLAIRAVGYFAPHAL